MKTKLLRSLRKKVYIEQRNSSFRVIDTNLHDWRSDWMDKDTARDLRRISILEYARIYFIPKRVIK